MASERLVSEANDARLIHLSEHLLWPMVKERVDREVETLRMLFKSGKETQAQVATLAAWLDLRDELLSKVQRGDRAFNKLQEQQEIL